MFVMVPVLFLYVDVGHGGGVGFSVLFIVRGPFLQ